MSCSRLSFLLAALAVLSACSQSGSGASLGQRCLVKGQMPSIFNRPMQDVYTANEVFTPQDLTLKDGECRLSDSKCLAELDKKEGRYAKATWKQVLAFVEFTRVNEHSYVKNNRGFVCHHFALATAFAARRKGVLAYYAGIRFPKLSGGHAVAAFPTSDRGWVYVDFTSAANANQCMKMIHGLAEGAEIKTLLLNDGKNRDLLNFDNSYSSFVTDADPEWSAFSKDLKPSEITIYSPFSALTDRDQIVKDWLKMVWAAEGT